MCVHAFKVATFPQKVSYSARTFLKMCEKQNRVSKSVFVERCDTRCPSALSRNSSRIFHDFRFPRILTKSRAFSRSDSLNLISKMSECPSWKSYFCAFDIMREKNFPRQMLPFHLRLVLPFFSFSHAYCRFNVHGPWVRFHGSPRRWIKLFNSKGLRNYKVWMVFFFFFLHRVQCIGINVMRCVRLTMC